MRWLIFVFFLISISCNQKPAQDESVKQPSSTNVPATATESSNGEEGIPMGAAKEEFADAPGLVRVTVNDQSGIKSADGYYLNNKRHGPWTEYQTNGIVKSVTNYLNGKKEGLYMELTNGQMTKRFYYHSGLRHGDYKEFTSNSLKEERNYINGKIEGTVKIYYDYTTKLMEESNYKNGLRDGTSKWYDQDGKLSIQYEYKNGELVKQN